MQSLAEMLTTSLEMRMDEHSGIAREVLPLIVKTIALGMISECDCTDHHFQGRTHGNLSCKVTLSKGERGTPSLSATDGAGEVRVFDALEGKSLSRLWLTATVGIGTGRRRGDTEGDGDDAFAEREGGGGGGGLLSATFKSEEEDDDRK
jgi:hypothetical protein